MSFAVFLTANAQTDIQQAIDWEDSRADDLGRRFFKQLEKRLAAIAAIPTIGSTRYDDVRCVKMEFFQYLIHYVIDTDKGQVLILRVLHTSRKPIW